MAEPGEAALDGQESRATGEQGQPDGGRAWVAALPAELAGQRALLTGLLDACEADNDIRWLLVGCSVARGAGDALSDLDLGMGVADDRFDAALLAARRTVDRLGSLVDSYHHQLPGLTLRHERIFAQYADRCQVDLVVIRASDQGILSPRSVLLYDADGRLTAAGPAAAGPGDAPGPTPEQTREWAFRAWCVLADMGKYLRRGSAWEALNGLSEGRGLLWQLWAAAHEVPDSQYGVTSVLDFAPAQLPAEMTATVADLDPYRLISAAREVARLLRETGELLPVANRAALPHAMAAYVTRDLAAIPAPAPAPAAAGPAGQG